MLTAAALLERELVAGSMSLSAVRGVFWVSVEIGGMSLTAAVPLMTVEDLKQAVLSLGISGSCCLLQCVRLGPDCWAARATWWCVRLLLELAVDPLKA